MKYDVSKLKVGDKCWSIRYGDCIIIELMDARIICRTNRNKEVVSYTYNGKIFINDAFQSLFPSNPFEESEETREEPAEYKWGNFYKDNFNSLIIPYEYSTEAEALKRKTDTLLFGYNADYYGTFKIETKPAKKFRKVTKWEEVK